MIDIDLIRKSYQKHLKPELPRLADLFYWHLWRDFPDSKSLFIHSEMDKQKRGLGKAIDFIVQNINRPDELTEYLENMGIRHSSYGVKPRHYAPVGVTLMKSLKETYGKNWNQNLEAQWTLVFEEVFRCMKHGVEQIKVKKAS